MSTVAGQGPLITYTRFANTEPTRADTVEYSDVAWHDFVTSIRNAREYPAKEACPLIKLAEFGDHIGRTGCVRSDANMKRIFGVEGDYDGEKMPLDEAAKLLQNERIEAVLVTTARYSHSAPRWRVLAPLGDPEVPEKRSELVGRLNRILGGVLSKESFTLSQPMFVGRVAGIHYEVIETHGRTIDMAAEFQPLYYSKKFNGSDTPIDPTTDAELRLAFVRGHDRYQSMLSLSSRWAARGMREADIAAALTALMTECPAGTFNADGTDLAAQIPKIAQSAWLKFGETRQNADEQVAAFFADIQQSKTPPQAPQKPPEATKSLDMRRRINWADLAVNAPPARSWAVEGWLGRGHVTLMAGPPGAGKTALAQSWGACTALGLSAVDYVKDPLVTLLWAGEDDEDELKRRQLGICRWLAKPVTDFTERFIVKAYPDRDITLCSMARDILVPTPVLKELREQIGDYKAELVFLDSIARLYGGNENDRHQVTQFITWLNWALAPTKAAICLLGHPAKAAGSEFSGSTAWEASVRARLYFGYKPPDQPVDEDALPDDDIRYLAKRKANYSQNDIRVVRWSDGCMQPQDAPEQSQSRGAPSLAFVTGETLRIFRSIHRMGVNVSDSKNAPNYLPAKAASLGLIEPPLTKRDLIAGLRELLKSGQLIVGEAMKGSNRMPKIGLMEPK